MFLNHKKCLQLSNFLKKNHEAHWDINNTNKIFRAHENVYKSWEFRFSSRKNEKIYKKKSRFFPKHSKRCINTFWKLSIIKTWDAIGMNAFNINLCYIHDGCISCLYTLATKAHIAIATGTQQEQKHKQTNKDRKKTPLTNPTRHDLLNKGLRSSGDNTFYRRL